LLENEEELTDYPVKTKSQMLDTLDKLSINIADYDLAEDLNTIETLMK